MAQQARQLEPSGHFTITHPALGSETRPDILEWEGDVDPSVSTTSTTGISWWFGTRPVYLEQIETG